MILQTVLQATYPEGENLKMFFSHTHKYRERGGESERDSKVDEVLGIDDTTSFKMVSRLHNIKQRDNLRRN